MPWEISRSVATRRLMYGTALGLLLSLPGVKSAHALCAPAPTAGDDTVLCDNPGGGTDAAIDLLSGTDSIRIFSGDEVTGLVDGNSGTDTLIVSDGTAGTLFGNFGDDTLVVDDAAAVVGQMQGGSGTDSLFMSDGAVGDGIVGLFGNSGSDTINISGGQVNGAIAGDELAPATGDGDDVLIVSGGNHTAILIGNGGNDSFFLSGGSLSGLLGTAIEAGSGSDTIEIGGTMELGAVVSAGSGNDLLTMSGGSVADIIQGDAGDDTLTVSGGVVTGNGTTALNGGDGADTLEMGGTAQLAGDIAGGLGNDRITLSGGSATDALGEADDDAIFLAGAILSGSLDGGDGNDTLVISSGEAVQALGGSGTDSFAMSGGDVDTLAGGLEADVFDISGGIITELIQGDEGADIVTLSGTAVVNHLLGGSENDTFFLTSATSLDGTLSGEAGDDSLFVSGAGVGGNFDGLLVNIDTLDGGDGTGDVATFSGLNGVLSEGFEGYETVNLVSGTTLDLHNPASFDRFIAGDADVLFNIEAGSAALADGNGDAGMFTLDGTLVNQGLFSMQDGAADDRSVVQTIGVGGGTLAFDAALDATEIADLLIVASANGVLGGTQGVQVNDVGTGVGALTGTGPGNGIALIDVSASGVTDGDDFFLLGGPIQAGAVEYDLVLETDGIWYLQSSFLAQVFGYAATPSAAVAMGQEYLASLRERVGTREQSWTGGAVQSSEGTGVWLRGGGNFAQVEDGNGFDYDQDHWFAQAGADFPLLLDPNGPRLIGGLFAHYGTSDITSQDETGADAAKGTLDAWGGGLSLTWYGSPEGAAGLGLYADLVGQVSVYDAEVKADGATGSTDGWGFGVSLEAGWGFEIGKNLRLIPQAQLSYSRVDLDDFTDSDGVDVEYGVADSLEGRAGFAVDSGKLWRSGNITFDANIVHEFLGESEANAEGLDIGTDLQGTAAEIGLGGTVSLLDNVSLYADVDYRIPLDEGREAVSANLGVRISW